MNYLNELIVSQYEAALGTVKKGVEACSEDDWRNPVGELQFNQVAFHTLFYADYYLCSDPETIADQEYHQLHRDEFRDYEELEPREQVLQYTNPFIVDYADFCRDKASRVVRNETVAILQGPSGFERRKCTRAELHVYNIRHIQHHAAQLSLRLRLNTGDGVAWVGHGWPE